MLALAMVWHKERGSVIRANNKWFTCLVVAAEIIALIKTQGSLDLRFPEVDMPNCGAGLLWKTNNGGACMGKRNRLGEVFVSGAYPLT